MAEPNMDPRSIKYLEKAGIKMYYIHQKKYLKECSNILIFLFADINVLNMLNKSFPKYINKFILSTRNIKDVEISDPYTMNDNEYLEIMKKISLTIDNLDLKDF